MKFDGLYSIQETFWNNDEAVISSIFISIPIARQPLSSCKVQYSLLKSSKHGITLYFWSVSLGSVIAGDSLLVCKLGIVVQS